MTGIVITKLTSVVGEEESSQDVPDTRLDESG